MALPLSFVRWCLNQAKRTSRSSRPLWEAHRVVMPNSRCRPRRLLLGFADTVFVNVTRMVGCQSRSLPWKVKCELANMHSLILGGSDELDRDDHV